MMANRRHRLELTDANERAATERIYESRRDAHLEFLRMCEVVMVGLGGQASPSSTDLWERFHHGLVAVEVFGTATTAELAQAASGALLGAVDDNDEPSWVEARESVDRYRAAVRLDLGVDRS